MRIERVLVSRPKSRARCCVKEYRSEPDHDGFKVLKLLFDELRFIDASMATFVPVSNDWEKPTV